MAAGGVSRAVVAAERDALCAALVEAGPHAPTLCTGWSAHDLAAHVWQLRFDPVSLPGIGLAALAPVTAARASALKGRWPFVELVRRIGAGWGRIPVFGADLLHHVGEYFVHTEDVRRGAGLAPRALDAATQDALWRRLEPAARARFRRYPHQVVFQREDAAASLLIGRTGPAVTVIGTVPELFLYAYRRGAAEVRLVGEDGAPPSDLPR